MIPVINVHAVIHDGTLVFLPGTPPGTNSRHSPGTLASAHTDENPIIHGDEPNCPAPSDGIGPMSERDPNGENAVDINFNDDISDDGLTVVNMSATTLSVLRIVEIVCICTRLNSNVHLILLTIQLRTEPEQNQ
jgi:hypothetical protein